MSHLMDHIATSTSRSSGQATLNGQQICRCFACCDQARHDGHRISKVNQSGQFHYNFYKHAVPEVEVLEYKKCVTINSIFSVIQFGHNKYLKRKGN